MGTEKAHPSPQSMEITMRNHYRTSFVQDLIEFETFLEEREKRSKEKSKEKEKPKTHRFTFTEGMLLAFMAQYFLGPMIHAYLHAQGFQ